MTEFSDMTEDERHAIRLRAYEAIASVEETKARLAARAERRLWAGSDLAAPGQPEPPLARQRAPVRAPEGRDWIAEQRWIEGIIDRRLAGLVDGIGQVVAGERKASRAALEAMRRELRSEFVKILGELRIETRAALAAGGAELAKGLERVATGIDHIEKQLANLDYSNGTLMRLDAKRLAPN